MKPLIYRGKDAICGYPEVERGGLPWCSVHGLSCRFQTGHDWNGWRNPHAPGARLVDDLDALYGGGSQKGRSVKRKRATA